MLFQSKPRQYLFTFSVAIFVLVSILVQSKINYHPFFRASTVYYFSSNYIPGIAI